MQDLSFRSVNQIFKLGSYEFYITVHSFQNVYTLDPEKTEVIANSADAGQEGGPSHLSATCSRLLWAGGQEEAEGEVSVQAVQTEAGKLLVDISAYVRSTEEMIRCVKLAVRHIPTGELINLIDPQPKKIPPLGHVVHYPEAWREAGTPLVILRPYGAEDEASAAASEETSAASAATAATATDTDDAPEAAPALYYFRSHDTRVRCKRFAFVPEAGMAGGLYEERSAAEVPHGTAWDTENGLLTVEMIFEEDASRMTNRVKVPTWEVGTGASVAEIYKPHQAAVEKAYGLKTWEERSDVPAWMREISLIVQIHGQHWTGHIFHDYDAMLEDIRRLSEMIDPKRILAFLPGWEGRYYWKYGNFNPDERMGGEEGFHRLCDGAKKLGVRLMPMFGANNGGTNLVGYMDWGRPSEVHSPSGNQTGISVDWDGSRHFDHSCNRQMNPGAPKWQNRMVTQLADLVDRYGFDGIFLDISAGWHNDANFPVYDGIKEMIRRLKEGRPDLLIAGEAWYDGIGAFFPVNQCGETAGHLNWHDEAYIPMVGDYCRLFGHLSLGDAAFGSSGVHELGYNPQWNVPLRKSVIPTLSLVDGTLDAAPEAVQEIIRQAEEYAEKFL